MKLSSKEVELISKWPARLKRRKRDAWSYFVSVTALMVATHGYGMFPYFAEGPVLAVAMTATIFYLANVYFAVRPEDKLVELLRRYIDRDPEAIEQIAAEPGPDGVSV